MTEAEHRMAEARALRDAALALVKADIAHLQTDLNAKGIGARVLERLAEGASDVLDEATDVAENHRGVLVTLVAAIVLWFARHPLMALFTGDEAGRDDDEAEAKLEGA
ncbi:hypothetical protein GRI72_05600 [Altererythrobacter marinus]|uniref:DUF3618 domain-containing protein n=1 Tax=Pelagerythrobacter marinus TaxID=538382 RepID=A0ABW9UXH6_9SPHN|nr:hypothetical protein [Pelagerythrobacter marinus]MXO68300.1 hypothetical protein [Pelagerythrobacter marinus]